MEPPLLAPELRCAPRGHPPLTQGPVLRHRWQPLADAGHAAELPAGEVLPLLHGHVDEPGVRAVGPAQAAVHEGDVLLLHAVRGVHHREVAEGAPGLPEDLDAARVAVQPVADAALPRLAAAGDLEALVRDVDEVRVRLLILMIGIAMIILVA